MKRATIAVAMTVFSIVAGCHRSAGSASDTHMDRPSRSRPIQSEANEVDRLVAEIQRADSPQAEADAIGRLRNHLVDQGLTYTIRAFRTYDNVAVDDPSTRPDPLRVEATIFRGRDTVRSFQFVPRANRNLVLLGE